MNLYQRLLNILSESITPEYWSEKELCRYIEMGAKEFARRTKITRRHAKLSPKIDVMSVDENFDELEFKEGSYEIPFDCLSVESVQWDGKPLDKKSLTFMEARYAGTSEYLNIRGSGRFFDGGWRVAEGLPVHWLYDDKSIRLFPDPKENFGIFYSNLTSVPARIPIANISRKGLKVYLYKRKEKTENNATFFYYGRWSLIPETKYAFCNMNGTLYVEPTAKFRDELTALQEEFKLTLAAVLPSHSASIDYVYSPRISFNDIFSPDGIESDLDPLYDEAVADYAAFLALTKEGSKTQDIQKADIYLRKFEEEVEKFGLSDRGVDIDFAVQMPFII